MKAPFGLVVGIVLAVLAGSAGARADDAAPKPKRIVSLNMCLDELTLALADRDAIASVTWLSRDKLNGNMAEAAERVPVNKGSAEEVLSARPDLILVGPFTPAPTRAMLAHVDAPLREFGVPETLGEVRAQIRDVAGAIGEPARGEAMVAELDRRLARASVDPRLPKLRAIILRPNGFTVGPGSLVDELLDHAGLENLAARLDIGSYEQMPLERIASLDADVLVANSEGVGLPSLATEALHHPMIAALSRKMRVVAVPARLWTCAGPWIADAVQLLADATADLRARRAGP